MTTAAPSFHGLPQLSAPAIVNCNPSSFAWCWLTFGAGQDSCLHYYYPLVREGLSIQSYSCESSELFDFTSDPITWLTSHPLSQRISDQPARCANRSQLNWVGSLQYRGWFGRLRLCRPDSHWSGTPKCSCNGKGFCRFLLSRECMEWWWPNDLL